MNRVSRFTSDRQPSLGQRADHLHLAAPAPGVLPHRRLARLRARRQPLHLHGRQHEPVRARLQPDRRAARPPDLGRPAHVGEHEQPERQDPPHPAGRRTPTGTPGVGTTYTIPPGNMFDERGHRRQTLPEIYAMGFRNPFRIHVDQKTGWVLMGDYGPDAGSTDPNRGPQGSVEFNVVKEPGFYGWPYCIRENVPYNDITYTSQRRRRHRQRRLQLRRAGQRLAQQHRPDEPAAGQAGDDVDGLHARPTRASRTSAPAARRSAAPRYYFDEDIDSTTKFPRVLRRPVVHRRVEQRLDQDRDARTTQGLATGVQPACAHLHGLHQPDGHRVRSRRLAVRRRVGPGLRREQPGLRRLPGRLHPGRAARRSRTRPSTTTPVPVGTTVQFSSAGSQRPGRHDDHLPVGLRRRHADVDRRRTRRTRTRRPAPIRRDADRHRRVRRDTAVDTVPRRRRQPAAGRHDRASRRTARSPTSATRSRTRSRSSTPRTARPAAGSTATTSGSSSSSAMTRTRTSCPRDTGCEGDVHDHRRRRPRRRREHLHGHHGEPTPTRATARRRRVTGRARGDPPAQAQAGRVLRDHGPDRGRSRHRRPGRRDGGDHRRRRRPGGRVHRGRRLDLVQPVQPRGPRQGHVPRRLRRRGRHDRAALRRGRRPARGRRRRTSRRPAAGRRGRDVTIDLPATIPEGTHRLFVVFRHPTPTGVADEPELVQVHRQGRGGHARRRRSPRPPSRVTGEAPLERGLRRHGDRRRGRGHDLRLGLRRPRHDDRHLDPGGPELHVHARRATTRRP